MERAAKSSSFKTLGRSRQRYFVQRERSCRTIDSSLPPPEGCRRSKWMKHSEAAVAKKQRTLVYITGSKPKAAYKNPPSAGAVSPEMAAAWLTTAFPRTMLSPESIEGMQACTVGVSKAPRTERKTKSWTTGKMESLRERVKAVSRTAKPVRASSRTIRFRRSIRSARKPPRGESRMVGTTATESTPPKRAAEPVRSRMYIERAKRRMELPKRELACPKIRSRKFRVKSFFFIPHPPHSPRSPSGIPLPGG